MYANIYQMRTNKHNFDKNNYISSLKQKNNYQSKPITGTYLNKRPSSTKYINQPQPKNQNMIYDSSKNILTKAKPTTNRRTNSSM